jgi:tRNA-2-methylthio-N6-dimethylallyladenosine synthase
MGVVGCMAQAYKEKIFEKAPWVDFVVGPSDIHKIPQIIENVTSHKSQVTTESLFDLKIWETDGSIRPEEIYHTGFYQDKDHTYVVISEGCSNFCSYCIVPYVRGPLKNRNYKDILKEIEEAIDRGITKITLLGQNVNAYQYGGMDFIKLLELVNSTKGLKEFSFITSHPKDTTPELFKTMSDLEKLKKYLHLPVQSGSDRILKLMKREYTRDFYVRLVDDYRKFVKNGVLTTDIMVGFPTETEKDFEDTVELVKNIQFDSAYIFKYSVRPYTEAINLKDDVPLKEKKRRHALLLELQKKISCQKKKSNNVK